MKTLQSKKSNLSKKILQLDKITLRKDGIFRSCSYDNKQHWIIKFKVNQNSSFERIKNEKLKNFNSRF